MRKDYEFLKGDEVPAFDNIGVLKEFLSITFFRRFFVLTNILFRCAYNRAAYIFSN